MSRPLPLVVNGISVKTLVTADIMDLLYQVTVVESREEFVMTTVVQVLKG